MIDARRIVLENRRAVWIISAGLIVNAALYVLVVYPLSRRVQTEQQQADDATRELVSARRAFAAATGTVSGKQQADEELRKFYRDILPADLSHGRRLLYPNLGQLAKASNLTPVTSGGVVPAAEAQGSNLRKLTLTLTLAGEYTNIRRFIHELETSASFLVLESVNVTQGEEGERRLNVTATVATYYRDAANGN